jgi:hypothetical protein
MCIKYMYDTYGVKYARADGLFLSLQVRAVIPALHQLLRSNGCGGAVGALSSQPGPADLRKLRENARKAKRIPGLQVRVFFCFRFLFTLQFSILQCKHIDAHLTVRLLSLFTYSLVEYPGMSISMRILLAA